MSARAGAPWGGTMGGINPVVQHPLGQAAAHTGDAAAVPPALC